MFSVTVMRLLTSVRISTRFAFGFGDFLVVHDAKLVELAGITMQEVVDSAQRVAAITSDITMASNEQNGGIEQVKPRCDRNRQPDPTNAVRVKQSAAAAQTMQDQAA